MTPQPNDGDVIAGIIFVIGVISILAFIIISEWRLQHPKCSERSGDKE
jgi:hypothetical protein